MIASIFEVGTFGLKPYPIDRSGAIQTQDFQGFWNTSPEHVLWQGRLFIVALQAFGMLEI
jgi:hypothetical protein